MFIRTSTVKRNGNTYAYHQLVESFRQPDGKIAHRVIAHLGKLPDATVAVLKKALHAARTGQTILTSSEVAELLAKPIPIIANLRYLDLAVLLDCWNQWDLSRCLDDLAGSSEAEMTFSQTVLPLVFQRCTVPDSKIEATRWLPTTALPEMLGFPAPSFNNTRVHRALDTLYKLTPQLQDRLPQIYRDHDGPFTTLFMDVTDTYFEGLGCPMAEQTRTKSEMPHKRCLAILLLVNQMGYPLRWKMVGGKTKDWTSMSGLIEEIGRVDWIENTLIVFDRAMGNRSTVSQLKKAGLHFLTAAHVDTIDSYTTALASWAEKMAQVPIDGTDESYKTDIQHLADAARKAGFLEIHDHLFAIDLEVATPPTDDEVDDPTGPLRQVAYFNPRLCVDIRRRTTGHCFLIQAEVERLNAELASAKRSRNRDSTYRKFTHELHRLHYLDAFDVTLEPITITSAKGSRIHSFHGTITRCEHNWAQRRKYDGFILLLGHPDLLQSATELVQAYRGKDVVEKDFQTIKSVVNLRPIYHHTDPKVQAHITLCMLALLLERTLEHRLRPALPQSAPTYINTLADCRLNLRAPVNNLAVYDLTLLNDDQRRIIDTLKLEHLADSDVISSRIVLRSLAA